MRTSRSPLYKLALLGSIVILAACGGGSGGDTSVTSPSGSNTDYDLHGKWILVNSDEGDSFTIYSNSGYSYERIDSDLISIQLTDGSYGYAMRAGTSSALVSGRLVSNTTGAKSGQLGQRPSGLEGVILTLENVDDPGTTTSAITEPNGRFETTRSVPAGNYEISVPDTTTKQIVVVDDEAEDLGTYSVVADDTNNFKLDFELVDTRFVFADNKQYYGKIIVENISETISVGLSYDITLTDPSVEYFRRDIVLGSVLAGEEKEIPVVFRFSAITEEKRIMTISVTIRDINGLEWQEDLNFTVYRDKFYINIQAATANVNGYVVLPFSDKVIKVDTQAASIVLPVVSDQFKMLLSNPSIDTESVYSLGVQRSASLSGSFNSPAAYEPNNVSSTATTIEKGDQVEAYVNVGDLDYWIITGNNAYNGTTNSTGYPQITANGNYLANTYYYLNLTDETYFDFIALSNSDRLSINDINLKELYTPFISSGGTNYGIPAGEYIIKFPYGFSLYGTVFSDFNFTQITANGNYLANTYYYLNLTDETYFDFIALSNSDRLSINDINLKELYTPFISSGGTNYGIPAGEYIIKFPYGFSVTGF